MKNILKKIVGAAFAPVVGAAFAPVVGAAFAPVVGAAFLPPRGKALRPSRGGRNAAPTMLAPTALLLALTFGLALGASADDIVATNITAGGAGYTTLQAAVNAVGTDETVKMLADATGYVKVTADKKFTLDMNGKSLEATGSTSALYVQGDLTVTGNGTITQTNGSARVAITMYAAGAKLTFESGTVNGSDSAIMFWCTNATVVINGGTFNSDDDAVLRGYGGNVYGTSTPCSNNTTTVNGGVFNASMTTKPGKIACGVYSGNNDTWNLNGGTFNVTKGVGVLARAGTVNINGATFNVTAPDAPGKVCDGATLIDGAVVAYDTEANYPGYVAATDKIQIDAITIGDGKLNNVGVYVGEKGVPAVVNNSSAILAAPKGYVWNDDGKLVYNLVQVAVTDVTGATSAAYTNAVSDATKLSGSSPYTVESNANVFVVYTANANWVFPNGLQEVTNSVTASEAETTVTLTDDQKPIDKLRAPDYATDGKDWLFNHEIEGKKYENEPVTDNDVDIFYVYPTLMTDREKYLEYNGFRLIDDPEFRELILSTKSSSTTAYGAFWNTGRALADLGRVYAPFYRQATNDKMLQSGTVDGKCEKLLPGLGTANAALIDMLHNGYGYLDITNALETYFTKWNKNADGSRRKFILAGHSQGSATLMLAMEHYFTQDSAHKNLLTNLVASYQIGMGVGKQWVADLEEHTKTDGFDGVKFASDATGTCVVVSYNTTGETTGEPCASILLPKNPVSINPISWTTNDTPADKSLNLGSLEKIDPEEIVAGLHSAQVNLTRGTVESCGFTEAEWTAPTNLFGEASLHGWDYRAFWENIRQNGALRAGLNKVTYEVFQYAAGECPKPAYVLSGEKIVRPTDPTSGVEGVFFGGWYTNVQCSAEAYNFATPVTTNFTLYACWTNETGKFLSPALLPGAFLPEPKEPRDGFTANWQPAAGADQYQIKVQYSNEVEGTTWNDFLTTNCSWKSTAQDILAEAGPGSYRYVVNGIDKDGNETSAVIETTNMVFRVPAKVTFQSEIPDVPDTGATNQFVYVGDCAEYENLSILSVTNKADNTVTRYMFKGWYTDSTCTQTNDFTQAVTNDLTLYALWKKIHAIQPCPDYASISNIVAKTEGGPGGRSAVGAEYSEFAACFGGDPSKVATNLMLRMVTSTTTGVGQAGYAQDVFLCGEHVELGLHRNGAFGTKTKPNTGSSIHQVHTWSGELKTFGMRASMTGWGDKNSGTNIHGWVVYMCPRCGYSTNVVEKFKKNQRCPIPDCHTIGQTNSTGKILQNDVNGTLTRDFFTPGTKDEGWLISTGGKFNDRNNLVGAVDTARGQQGYDIECNGLNLDKDSTALSAKVYYKGNGGVALPGNTNLTLIAHTELKTTTDKKDRFKITQDVEFQKYDTGFDTWVTISNMTDTVQTNVCYFRGFDPDQPNKWYQGAKNNTDNFYYKDAETHDAYVIASATNHHLSTITTLENVYDRSCTPFMYYAPDPQNDPQVEHKYTITPVTMTPGWTTSKAFSTPENGYHRFFDTAMGIRFDIGDMKPGESVRIYYYTSLDSCSLRAAKNIQKRGGVGFMSPSVPTPQFDTNHVSYAWVRESVILYPKDLDGKTEKIGFMLNGPREVNGKFGNVYFVSKTCSSVNDLQDKSIWLVDPCEVVTNPVVGTSIGYVAPVLPLKDGTYYAYYVSADNVLSSALEFFMAPQEPLPVYYKAALSDKETGTEWFDFSSCSNPPAVYPYDCTDTNAFKYLTYSGATLVDTNGVARPLSDYLRTTEEESIFGKWYVNSGTAENPEYTAYDFSQRLTNSVTLYAGWKKRSGLAIAEEGATNDVSVAESGEGWEFDAATQQLKLNSLKIDEEQGWLTVTNTMKIEIAGTVTNVVPGKGTPNTTLLIVDGDKTVLSDVTISNVTAIIISATDRERADQETNRVVYLSGVNTFAPDGKSVFSKLPYAKGSLTLRSLAGTDSAAAYGRDRLIITPRNRTPVVNENYVAISNLYIQGGTYGANMPCKYVDEKGGYWYFDNGDSTWTAWPFADVTFVLTNGLGVTQTYTTVRTRKLFTMTLPTDPVWPFDPAVTNCFMGWVTADGTPWTAETVVTGHTTVYATWKLAGAVIFDENGNPVPVKDPETAIEKVNNGGDVYNSPDLPPTSKPYPVNKPVVITIGSDPSQQPPSPEWYQPGDGYTQTTSGNKVIVGEVVSNYVFVAQDVAPTVEEGVKPREVAEDDWEYLATNVLTEVTQKGAETNEFGVCTNTVDLCAFLKPEVKSNIVVRTTSEIPNVDAVRVTVNVAVTPKDIRRNQESKVAKDMGYVKYAFDVTPVMMIEAFANGGTTVVASNEVMVSASDFVSGTVFRVVLSAKGMRNVNKVVHILENGRIDEYANGTSATLTTFTWDSTAGQVVILATENSEFQIWASETDGDIVYELKAGPELDIPGFIITNVGMAVSYVTNVELKVSHGYANLPTVESMFREGYDFDGWHYTNRYGGAKIVLDAWGHKSYAVDSVQTNGGVFAAGEEDHTLYARWVKAPLVTYDAQGGKFADGTESYSKYEYQQTGYQITNEWVFTWSDATNATYALMLYEPPTREGYTFLGWYDGWTNNAPRVTQDELIHHVTGTVAMTGTKLHADHTLYARWKSNAVAAEDAADGVWTNGVLNVAERAVGGSVHAQKGVSLTNAVSGSLPATFIIPERIVDVTNSAPVVAIKESAFSARAYTNGEIKAVYIPAYMTSIGQNAFFGRTDLTNIVFSQTRDYATGEKTTLEIGASAFEGTDVRQLVFPSGLLVYLNAGCFAGCTNLEEIVFQGELKTRHVASGPFRRSGKEGGSIRIKLSPTMAASASLVQKLTNAMNSAYIELDSKPLGEITIKDFSYADPVVSLTFETKDLRTWGVVNEKTVRLFYATDLGSVKNFVGTGNVLYPTTLTGPDAGVYSATFEKSGLPSESGFFCLTVGSEK